MLCIQLESLVCVWSPHLQSTGSIQPLHIATTLSNEADHWLLTLLTCSKLLITDPTMKGTCPSLLFKIYLTWFLCFTHPMLRQSVGNLLYTKEASYFYVPVLYTVPILRLSLLPREDMPSSKSSCQLNTSLVLSLLANLLWRLCSWCLFHTGLCGVNALSLCLPLYLA